jgi:hypothetical protein
MFSGRDITLSIIISDRSDQNHATNITLRVGSCLFVILRTAVNDAVHRRRQYASLKRRFTSMRLHGAVSQRTVVFVLATLRT